MVRTVVLESVYQVLFPFEKAEDYELKNGFCSLALQKKRFFEVFLREGCMHILQILQPRHTV